MPGNGVNAAIWIGTTFKIHRAMLLVTPITFLMVKRHQLKRGRLKLSGLRTTEKL